MESKKSLKHILGKDLVVVSLFLMAVVIIVVGYGLRTLVINTLEDKAVDIAQVVKAGLTAHMKSDMIGKREYFLSEIASLHEVKSLFVIRSEAVNRQFGMGGTMEKAPDAESLKVFLEKKPRFLLNEFSGVERVLYPYIADSTGSLNCLSCHDVEEGHVLGVLDMEFDFSEYRNLAFFYIVFIIFILAMFFILVYLRLWRRIHRSVLDPLNSLIVFFRRSGDSLADMDAMVFKNEEMNAIARDINMLLNTIKNKNSEISRKNIELTKLSTEVEFLVNETLFTLGSVAEMRSEDSKNHIIRVSKYSRLLATRYGLDKKEAELVSLASTMHDLGKIAIPDGVLLKPGKLSEPEFEVMKSHARQGYEMLKNSERPALRASATIALEHHEKWDGSGYPEGKKGEAIHLYARIVAIADVYDALSSNRCYKQAWESDRVYRYIASMKGIQFDPALTDILLQEWPVFESIRLYHQDSEGPIR